MRAETIIPRQHPTDPHAFSRPRKVGKYLVSPLVKVMDNDWFASSVSIRSGSGATTTDRVLRLTRLFRSPREAAAYARAEALQWMGTPSIAAAPPSINHV